ncbi:MAG: tetratricopeptide repeat protein [Salibacteraceae bacterium]
MKYIPKISLFLVFLVAFALGLKQIHEPDLWWMFRTGEWMVQNQQIPTVDVFSYTHKGVDWISVKWLFELIAYGFANLLGPESIGVLQAVVNILLTLFFIKIVVIISKSTFDLEIKPSHPILIIGAILFLFSSDYRLVGRPEMFSHLLTIIYLWLYINYKHQPGKFIFWLIPLQILWVNMHEAFAVGMVLLLTFIGGEILDYLLAQNKDKKKLQTLVFACGLAFLAVAINPRGFYMFYHPYFLFSVVESNHYTNELNSFFFRPDFFFSFKEPFITAGLFIVSTASLVWLFLKRKTVFLTKIGTGYVVITIAFLYLGMTGYRNVIFPIIVLFPFTTAVIISISKKWNNAIWNQSILVMAFVLPLVFYIGIGSNQYYKNFQSKDRFGLATYADSNPAGAAHFIQQHNLQNERAFTDYLTSAYFLWTLRPGFESFIDLRDLDIFPKTFFDDFFRITYFTNLFEESDTNYNYNHAILYTWEFPNLHRYLYHSPNWKQVYADNVAAVYLKNKESNQRIISQFESDSSNLYGNFSSSYQPKPNIVANAISFAIWPGYEMRVPNLDSSIFASKYFRIVADFDRAEFHAKNAIKNNTSPYEGYNELGSMYLEIVPFKRTPQGKAKYIEMAKEAYGEGYILDKNRYECLFGLAQCAFASGNYGYAIKQYKKANKVKPGQLATQIKIADCYGMLSQQNPTQKVIDGYFEYLNKAYKIDPANMDVITKLAIGYCQQNKCNLAAPFLKQYTRSPNRSEQDHQQILTCKKKCLKK